MFEDGEYKLYVKTLDNAGNGKTYESPIVTVNSTSTVVAAFTPPANPSYVQSHDVQFAITGLPQMSIISVTSVTYATYVSVGNGVYTLNGFNSRITPASIEVAYAFSELTARPDNTAYIPLDQFTLDGGNWNFTIPKNTGKNGLHYVHVRVKATSTAGTNVYYYSSAYYFDNNAPAVTFSNSGVAYPQASQSVSVTVTETLSRTGLAVSYQWVKDGSPAPDEHSTGWTTFTDTIRAEINNNALQPGEVVDYRLYVYVKDGAGNSYIASSQGIYKVSKITAELPPAPVKSDLIYTYGDAEDGYTAIVQLGLDQLDNKEGYDYSVSADNGVSWLPWKPYTNFVALKVPTKVAGNLQILVKYRTPGGVIGEPKTLDSRPTTTVEPVYAIATLSTTRSVSRVAGVDIDIALPLGIKAVPTAVNPSVPVRTGNRFHVDTNGFYSFELTDSADSNRKDILYVVVKNIDVTPPNATIEYTPSGTTRGNVTVSLSNASEPIRVINNSGRTSYTFTENGTFEFQYEDEAGNRNTVPAIAKMEKIDKEAPRVNIVRSYAYGENNSKTFNTIKDGNGNVLRSSGLTLEVQKADPSGKEVYVAGSGTPAENRVRTLYQNGVTSFTIYDDLGNMTIIEENVDNIVSEPPKVATVQYAFVDNDGNPLPAEQIVEIDGQQYARGKVKATLSGVVKAPNQVYSGMLDVNSETGIIIPDETRRISGSDGSFSTSRLYAANGTTTVAISDLLGNLNRVPVTVRGLDNTPPTITLNMSSAGIAQNKKEINPRSDLGGYVVSDNVSKPDKIEVTISGLNVEQLGRQRVTYTAKDEVGNTATAQQDVIVVSGDGMLIFANDVLISASSGESALFDSNKLVFNITRFNLVEVKGGQDLINEWGSYDVLYHTGLYREGEMKYIAQKVTYDELISGRYEVTFPEVGWYTIIVRNQEREREYATFFVARKE
ncbi:MAG: hypothetical protein K0R28_1794 [Paenibacillus sp.]|nr:hypothetical protein [Paenibacillus sp.]